MIPKHALDRLKCALCDNSLSIFPIHSYGNKDIVTCGRCSLQKDFLPQREHLYEEVARYIEFPCRYEQNGCIEKLRPADMQSHESSCLHKTCLCPILPLGQCKWQGPYSDLYQHCLDTHPIFTFKDFRIELDIVNAHDENYVFYQADKTFIAQIKSDPMNKKFYCNVICCDDESKTKEFSYRVRFVNDKTEFKCDKNEVDFSNISQFSVTDKTTSIDISNLISQLNNPSCVICKIDITDNSKISESKVTLLEDNSEILKALECPICFSCLSTPILQCNTGHSYCGSHRDQLIVCPICESDVEETRNYALEEIAHIIECPCTHQEFGCSYSATAKNIKEHESTCAHKPYRCFISSCNWESSLSNLKEHFIQQHKDIVVELNSVTYVLDEDEREKHEELVLFSHDKIFKLIFEQSSEGFIWSLQVIGDKSSSSKYMLELDFTSQWKEKIFIRKQCCSVDEFPEYDEDLFVELSFRQLKRYINDDILTYKVRVVEVY